MSDTSTIERGLSALRQRTPFSGAMRLTDFSALWRSFTADPGASRIGWFVILLADRAILSPVGNPGISFEVLPNGEETLTRDSFSFLPSGYASYHGALTGRYAFGRFVADIIGRRGASILGLVCLVATLLIATLGTPETSAQILSQLVQALSVLGGVFALFVLHLDPSTEASYLLNGRFEKLTASDQYVAMIAFSGLGLALFSMILTARLTNWHSAPDRWISATLTAIPLTDAFAAFYLVTRYHFSRRKELLAISLAKTLLTRLSAEAERQGLGRLKAREANEAPAAEQADLQ